MTYRIRLTIKSSYDKTGKYDSTVWVAKRDGAGTWDGSWFTYSEINQIKEWKTQGGAQRWLDSRPGVAGYMNAVIEQVGA